MYTGVYRQLRRFHSGGAVLHQRLQELDRTQWFSTDELLAWQLERVQRIVKYAFEHVPYYHDKYQRLGICPQDIKTFKDFEALPFLTREDVNSNLQALVSPELRSIALPNSTGGSTGEPMQFFKEKAFSYWDNALELRGRGWYGVEAGEKVAWVWGAQQEMANQGWKARLKARLLRERYLNAFDMTADKMRDFATMLVRWKPAMFRAYASALSLLAQFIRDNRIEGIHPRFIETSAEKVTAEQRELLEAVFACSVADWYTARELGTIAFECPGKGLHVAETRYLEVIANGRPAAPADLGEVVVTSTHQFAMPLIRYKLGDMAIRQPEPCSCGRGLPVLSEVVGRLQDFLVRADGHFVHGGFFPHTFRRWPEIFRYQVYQPDTRHLEVRLVCKHGIDPARLLVLRQEIQDRFGEAMQIELKLVDHFDLTRAGKHRPVISDVKPGFVD